MLTLIVWYISFAHLFVFTVLFITLDKFYLKRKRNIFIILVSLLCAMYIGTYYSYFDTLILIIAFIFLSVKNSTKRNVAHSLLVVATAYLLAALLMKVMRPLFLLNLASRQLSLFVLMLLLFFIYAIGVPLLINKWVFSRLYDTKMVTVIAYLLIVGIFMYQISWLIINYDHALPVARMFILLFYVFLFLSIVSFMQITARNEELKYQEKKRKLEYDMMLKHADEIKKQYQEMRHFRHDYINILSSIEYYLEQGKLDELKIFYQSNIKPTKNVFKANMLRLDDIQKIESIEIRSIISTKLITAQEKGIDVQVEIEEMHSRELAIDPIILIRILGIVLDNAIEELENLDEGQLIVGLFHINHNMTFVIQNSIRQNIEPLHVLKKKGFSTKGEERGMGLAIIEELMVLEPKLLIETRITAEFFVQKIMLTGGDT